MKTYTSRNDFSAGELNAEALQRKDSRAAQNGLQFGQNIRLRNGGGFSRRPGSIKLAKVLDDSERIEAYRYDESNKYILVFKAGRIDFYEAVTGTAKGSVTGCPWSAGQCEELGIAMIDERIIIAHQSFWPQQVTRTGAATWALADYAFDGGSGGSVLQPYYRYAAKGISIQPSALFGAITLTASSAVFNASHVGTRIRYVGKEILITAYTDSTHVSGVPQQLLPGTYEITMGTNSGFQVGQIVQGDTTNATGYIVALSGLTKIQVVIQSGLSGFSATEKIVGPDAQSTASAISTITPAAITVWDEQMISAARGYPGRVMIHRRRLGFTKFSGAPEAWCFSQTGSIGDFDVGTAQDAEAINERLTASPRESIEHIVPAETLVMLTKTNSYYCPEGRENVLTPTYSSLFKAAATGSAAAHPVIVDQGILFIDVTLTRCMLMSPTGQITSPWAATEITRLVPHFMNEPIEIAESEGNANAHERYAYVVNSDGTVACLFYRDDDPIYGWTLWSGQGVFKSMCSLDGIVYSLSARDINGTFKWFLEMLDENVLVDCAVSFTSASGDAALTDFVGASVNVVEETASYGAFTVQALGALPAGLPTTGSHTFQAGFSFGLAAAPISPTVLPDVKASGPYVRIPRAWLTVQDACVYQVNGQTRAAYDATDDDTDFPPLRSETRHWHFLGRDPSPTVSISQEADTPSPLTVLSIVMEVVG